MASAQEAGDLPLANADEYDVDKKSAANVEHQNVAEAVAEEVAAPSATTPTDEIDGELATSSRPKRPRTDDAAASDDEPAAKTMKVQADNHTSVVATHYNQLEEKGRAERFKSRIFYMRNFNNWIKTQLINEFMGKVKEARKHGQPLRVLDMCCGKGGDLLKWEKAGISHLICTDIADVSVQQCEERYNTMAERNRQRNNRFGGNLFSAEFFACDSTMQRLREKYRDPSMQLSLVSCQFAFHYCFESLKQAECMIRNAAECLQENGYFIGTMPDANEIMKRQRRADATEFGNDIYRISFLCDPKESPLFGAKYNFELDGVVNCPEFLVHFPLLEKLARKYGLRLVMKERFGDFFERQKERGRFRGFFFADGRLCSMRCLQRGQNLRRLHRI